jgi:phage terminase large subunit-like protein
VRRLSPDARRALVRELPAALVEELLYDWRLTARPEQLPPDGGWRTWLYLAGRGAGKTASGAGWVRSIVEDGSARMIGLCAPTIADVRDIIIKGPSGILNAFPPSQRPTYLPSKRRIEFRNGAVAVCLTAEEADCPRGHNLDAVWCDELAMYPNGGDEIWSNLQLALRAGPHPRTYVSTTPRPTNLIKRLVTAATDVKSGTVITRGKTFDNKANLPASFLEAIEREYRGTRLWRQEIEGLVLDDILGALWRLKEDIHERRVTQAPQLVRIVIGVDPAVTQNEDSDLTGIIVCGIDEKRHGYVLEDLSGRYSPVEWARKVVDAFHRWRADRVIVERNQGGDLVTQNLRAVSGFLPITTIHASKGKFSRAEPVATLYQRGHVHHVGVHDELELEMTGYSPQVARKSPDRMDALVYSLTDLMLGGVTTRDLGGYVA